MRVEVNVDLDEFSDDQIFQDVSFRADRDEGFRLKILEAILTEEEQEKLSCIDFDIQVNNLEEEMKAEALREIFRTKTLTQIQAFA